MINIKNLLIVLLLIILAFFVLSSPKYIGPETIISVKVDTIYKHDTLLKYKKGDLIPFITLDTIYQVDQIHDTTYIVKDYLTTKAYSDTLRINTDNSVYVYDTISQNKIIGRSYKANLTEKTIYVTNTIVKKPKNEFYMGLIGDLRRSDNMLGVGIGLNYKKQNEAYIFNLTTNQISFGLYKKLF
jgi:hypothetical protein